VTAADLQAAFDSVHVLSVVEDGDELRVCCSCRWMSVAVQTREQAAAIHCGAQSEHDRGYGRLLGFLIRQQQRAAA
jgi:hypothetical protein